MTDFGNFGTAPYKKVVLDNTVLAGTDTPYPLSFINDPQTGIYRKSAGVMGLGAGGIEAASFTAFGFTEGVGNNLTSSGTSIAGALTLTNAINFIGNAVSTTGVSLPTALQVGVGGSIAVFNNGAGIIRVYAQGSDTIDGTAGATGVTLTNAKRAVFYVQAALTWISAQLGAVSA